MSARPPGEIPDDDALVENALRKMKREGWSPERLGVWLYVSGNTVRNWESGDWERIETPTRRKLLWRFGYMEDVPQEVIEAREAEDQSD